MRQGEQFGPGEQLSLVLMGIGAFVGATYGLANSVRRNAWFAAVVQCVGGAVLGAVLVAVTLGVLAAVAELVRFLLGKALRR